VLDAARELFIHYGFDKTTVDDIARTARVAKSTLYARWRRKDDLLAALVWRESRRYTQRWVERVEADPEGGRFAGIFKNALLALADVPFIAAIYRQQVGIRTVRSLFGADDLSALYRLRQEYITRFMARLQDEGVIRADVDPAVMAFVANSLQFGFLSLGDMLDEPPTDAALAAMVDMLDVYLTPPGGGDSAAGKQIVREVAAQGMAMLEAMEKGINGGARSSQ
jgi:AcrR family transcriptional regulator